VKDFVCAIHLLQKINYLNLVRKELESPTIWACFLLRPAFSPINYLKFFDQFHSPTFVAMVLIASGDFT